MVNNLWRIINGSTLKVYSDVKAEGKETRTFMGADFYLLGSISSATEPTPIIMMPA